MSCLSKSAHFTFSHGLLNPTDNLYGWCFPHLMEDIPKQSRVYLEEYEQKVQAMKKFINGNPEIGLET